VNHLRIGTERVRLYGVGLFLIGMSQMRFVRSVGHFWDWLDFYIAGAMAGTRALLDPALHAAWGASHHLPVTAFVYMPGFAWVLVPAAQVPLAWGFALNAAVMVACCLIAASVAARTYQLSWQFCLLTILAWAPTTAAIVTAQNSPVGALLSLAVVLGFVRDDAVLTGLSVGALMYKPTYALPFVLLVLVFRRWKAFGVLCACGVVWYLLSVSATGGDWLWPISYLHSLTGYVGPDFLGNRFKAVSLPGLLMLIGTPHTIAFVAGLILLVAGVARMPRVAPLEAASIAGLVGLAASPHAWPYDAAVALPALFWVISAVAEPWRTRVIVTAFAIAPLWLASNVIHVDPLAFVIIGAAVAWVAGWVITIRSRTDSVSLPAGKEPEVVHPI
jgi:hypothetical protein